MNNDNPFFSNDKSPFPFPYDKATQKPDLAPIFGPEKEVELSLDHGYLQYMYPEITKDILDFIEDCCDEMEYEGSPMFDVHPDLLTFRLLAKRIYQQYTEKNPDMLDGFDNPLLQDLVEVLLYQEIMYRRNRYRNRRRLYF